METTLLPVRRLRGLQKLQLLIRARKISLKNHGVIFLDPLDPSCLQGMRMLFTIRNVPDVRIRDLDLEDSDMDCRKDFIATWRRRPDKTKQRVTNAAAAAAWAERMCVCNRLAKRQKAALRHLNRGLQLAQNGSVVHELYTKADWRNEDAWPALEGSDCGLDKGCSCKVSGDQGDADGGTTLEWVLGDVL
jgi:hypothetical protein